MDEGQVLEELKALVTEGKEKILPTKWIPQNVIGASYMVDRPQFVAWHTKALTFVKMVFQEDSEFVDRLSEMEDNYYSHAESCVNILSGIVEYVEKGFLIVHDENTIDTENELRRIFSKFHRVARQMRSRYNQRPTIEVNDEYDVQDLLHALLRIYFDDVRSEEWTPSYAGKSARMDFLLKKEKTVIEVKKTRQGLADKELGDELIIDVDRYKAHPDCNRLICFVYDPEGRVGNPEGLMKDLNDQHDGFVTVIIEPLN